MNTREEKMLLYGNPDPLPQRTALHAGPLTMEYERGDLRNIRLGDRVVVSRIYSALRDRNWGTVPNAISNEEFNIEAEHFLIRYDVENRQGDIHFRWHAEIEGDARGQMRLEFEGRALSDYWQSRTGFCILHPISTCAGKQGIAVGEHGERREGTFPTLIAPAEIPPFLDMSGMEYEVAPGVRAVLRFDGDLFEMEDQRNWTDASYKTFCTPLRLPCPRFIKAGERIHQAVTLSLEGDVSRAAGEAVSEQAVTTVSIQRQPAGKMPDLGLVWTDEHGPLSQVQTARLRALNLGHVRLDLRLDEADIQGRLERAWRFARDCGTSLEIALHLSENPADLAALAEVLQSVRPVVSRWLVFGNRKFVSDAGSVNHARNVLKPHTPNARFGGGSDADFYELNTNRPDPAAMDFWSYSINPQIHAFDNASLMETLETQQTTVESARAYSGGLPAVIGPVTLKQRFNPVATGPETAADPKHLPPSVDARQPALFTAAWTVGSLKRLAQGGASSVTYYETIGWKGVQEAEQGSPLAEKFFSIPDAVFPVYHVFKDAGEFAGANLLLAESSSPLAVEALTLGKDGRLLVLAANLTAQPQIVRLCGLPETLSMRLLDAGHAEQAMKTPEEFSRETEKKIHAPAGVLEKQLPPYAVLRLDGKINEMGAKQ